MDVVSQSLPLSCWRLTSFQVSNHNKAIPYHTRLKPIWQEETLNVSHGRDAVYGSVTLIAWTARYISSGTLQVGRQPHEGGAALRSRRAPHPQRKGLGDLQLSRECMHARRVRFGLASSRLLVTRRCNTSSFGASICGWASSPTL
jgi:hypothetical protein